MACFLVPTTEAIVTTIIEKKLSSKEKKDGEKHNSSLFQFSKKLKWLNNMLWGGSTLLAFEHLWHGEIVPFFPFLTAASNPDDAVKMLHEMATIGVTMAVLVTVVWIIMVIVSNTIEKRPVETLTMQKAK